MPQLVGFDYVKSWAGLLKIGEFFMLMIAFSCMADFADKSENNGTFKFFLFVTITSWCVTMILFALFLTGAKERLAINWTLAMLIYSVVVSILLLISASLVAEKGRKYRRSAKKYENIFQDVCDHYDESGSPCRNVEAAAAFGFISLALFLVDALFFFVEYRSATTDNNGFIHQDETGTYNYDRPNVEQIP